MGFLRFVKSAGAKIFGAAKIAAAPPEQLKQEAPKHGLDVSQVEVKSERDKAVLRGGGGALQQCSCLLLSAALRVMIATVLWDMSTGRLLGQG
ncbi:MAG: hypothetical protein WBE80_07920 [Methylocella sp.]